MGTTYEVQRLTIARFQAATPLTDALVDIEAAGISAESLSLTGARGDLERLSQDMRLDARANSRFLVLFDEPVPVIDLTGGSVAYSGRQGLLVRLKAAQDGADGGKCACACPVPEEQQQELAAGMRSGAVFLVVGSSNSSQYVRCQTLLLRHSAGRVLGVQYSWQPH